MLFQTKPDEIIRDSCEIKARGIKEEKRRRVKVERCWRGIKIRSKKESF